MSVRTFTDACGHPPGSPQECLVLWKGFEKRSSLVNFMFEEDHSVPWEKDHRGEGVRRETRREEMVVVVLTMAMRRGRTCDSIFR